MTRTSTFLAALGSAAALGLAAAPSATAVERSEDHRGQVLILPFVEASTTQHSELVVRNASDREGKAVRIVARDPVNGRPTATLNLYLGPRDAWQARIDLVTTAAGEERARIAPWTDASCTHPARDALTGGLVFSDALFDEDFGSDDPGDRLRSALVEVYEMGTLDPALAGDCGAIAGRWAPGGTWDNDPSAEVTAPSGSLEASAVVFGRLPARAFQFRGIALDGFRDAPLHTDVSSLSPNLADVRPAVSSRFETIQLANRRVRVEEQSTWESFPVNAVNAVLMARGGTGEFASRAESRGSRFAAAVLAFPTRPYHRDGFLLPAGTSPETGPFAFDALDVSVADQQGQTYAVAPPPGLESCDRAGAALTRVALSDSVYFSGTCNLQNAVYFVAGPPDSGQVRFSFVGRIVSDEGDVFEGQPVIPVLFQALTEPGVGGNRLATAGWSDYLEIER